MKSTRYSLICLISTTDNYLIRAVESLFVPKAMTTYRRRERDILAGWRQWMGLLKNFKWWKKIVIISCKYHIIRSLLPLLLTSARAYHGSSPLYCTVLQCNGHCTDCSARFSVESYNQIIIFPFPDNIFLPFLSQLCNRGRRERERGEEFWYCYDPHCCSFNPKLIIIDSCLKLLKFTLCLIPSETIINV